MANDDQGGMTRKQRRQADRAARKSGGSIPGSSGGSRSSGGSGPSMLLISIVALVIGLVAVAVLIVATGGFGDDNAAVAMPPDEKVAPLELRVGRSLGDPEAPVKIEAFEDPQCPACGLFTERIEPLLVNGPVKDGEVFFTYKDFAFLGEESFEAASAMRVAEELDGKFWDYHAIVFHNQDGENRGAFSRDRLADMAEAIGLDRDEFLAGMDDPQYLEAVQTEVVEGRDLGVSSTPTLVVNGQVLPGVPNWDELKALIDAEVEAAA